MDFNLNDAYFSVYSSSKEILKNKQRHLYCNMLDLLTSTCKTTNCAGTKIAVDDHVNFWLADILPLMFDQDANIQTNAIGALAQGLMTIDVSVIHSSSNWLELKMKIISVHAPYIHKLREDRNPNWHNIWCLLIRILDREILKGASTINSFLSIVELGFRSSDNNVRAESFFCWRLLIQIFSTYNELFAPKRIKLICIPLKSSQSKSTHAAVVKFRVWWYLITCLGQHIDKHFDTVVEPFLIFSLGGLVRGNTCTTQNSNSLRALVLPCLVALFAPESNDFLQCQLREYKLEPLCQPSPLLTVPFIKNHWRPLLCAAIDAIRWYNKSESTISESEQHLLQYLLRFLLRLDIPRLTCQLCSELLKMLPEHPSSIKIALNIIASEGLHIEQTKEDLADYSSVLTALTHLFASACLLVPSDILQRCIDRVFPLDCFRVGLDQWRALSTILEVVFQTRDDEDYKTFETKLLIWRRVSNAALDFLRENSLVYRSKDYASVLNRWVLWPLRLFVAFAGGHNNSIFGQNFCTTWKQLLNAGQNSFERNKFLCDLKNLLQELLDTRQEETYFDEIIEAYVASVLKLGFNKNSTLYPDMLMLLQHTLDGRSISQKSIEASINTLRNIVMDLKPHEMTAIFEVLRTTLACVVDCSKKGHMETAFYEEWKRAIIEKIRIHPNKSFISQVKEMFKVNDVFVIIPSVWSLNPDKLTDRQKERFAEKADIPALYNDMSQSQESSIKPWTPKKVVIAKGEQNEIVLENSVKRTDDTIKNYTEIMENDCQKSLEPCEMAKLSNPNTEEIYNILSTLNDEHILSQKISAAKGNCANTNKIVRLHLALREGEIDAQNNLLPDSIKNSLQESNISNRTRKPWLKKTLECTGKNDTDLITLDTCTKYLSGGCTTTGQTISSLPTENNNQFKKEISPATNGQKITSLMCAVNTATLCKNGPEVNQQAEPMNMPILVINENKKVTVEDKIQIDYKETMQVLPITPEISELKDDSPKKTSSKFTSLSSPPDRKLINNSSSPTVRPKPSAHLTGRGAQLINMIRNKKLDNPGSFLPGSSISKQYRAEKIDSSPGLYNLELGVTENTSTPIPSKDLLIFSKRLPSPTASPSASILKRKHRHDSFDDVSVDSPAFKRKRVSFHDPPVSLTKEYARDLEENKTKPKRCLILDKTDGQKIDFKHILKRRSKLDSIIEIQKYSTEDAENDMDSITSIYRSNRINDDNKCINTSYFDKSCQSAVDNTDIKSKNDDTALNYVIQNYSLDLVLSKYLFAENGIELKSATTLAKFVSNCMNTNSKMKAIVLETLSENHSKDFLDHAVQENLSSVVCDRLNLNSVIDYVCAKSKINTNCRKNLLIQIPEILKHSKLESDRLKFVEAVLQSNHFKNEQILDLVSQLISMRSTGDESSTSVSESAVDSSSNL